MDTVKIWGNDDAAYLCKLHHMIVKLKQQIDTWVYRIRFQGGSAWMTMTENGQTGTPNNQMCPKAGVHFKLHYTKKRRNMLFLSKK